MTKFLNTHTDDIATMDEFRLECCVANEDGEIHLSRHEHDLEIYNVDKNGKFINDISPTAYGRSLKAVSSLIIAQIEKRRG